MTFWNCLIHEWPQLDSCLSLRPPSEQGPITFSGLIQNNILSWSCGMSRPEKDKIQANQSYWWKILRDTFVRQCEIRLRRMIAISSHSFLAIVAFGPCQRWLAGRLSWQEQILWEVGERRPPTVTDWHNDIIKKYTPLSVKICFLLWHFFSPKLPKPQKGRQWHQRGSRLLISKFQNFHFQVRIAIARGR